jgi:lysophospholipase L1-like esterase
LTATAPHDSVRAVSRALKRVLSLVLGLLLSIATFEAGSRLLGIHFPALRSAEAGLWTYDPVKGWFQTPGAVGRVDLGGPDAGHVRINSLGLRGPETPLAKAPGVKRVVVLGDSFVFGVGVDQDHVFTTRLQNLIEARRPGEIEVLNLGVAGYSTDQELLLFEDLGQRLRPDVVVLVMCDNDFEANTLDFVYGRYYKPTFELEGSGDVRRANGEVPRLGSWQSVKLWLGQRSNLWNFVRSRTSRRPRLQGLLDAFQVATPRRSGADELELTTRLVVRLRDRAEATGARFVAFNTGHRGERTTLFHALRPRLAQQGVEHLGLEEFLGKARARQPDRNWDFAALGDIHWNVDGHQLAAQVVYTHLNRLGWLP